MGQVEKQESLPTVAKGQMPVLSKAAQYHQLQLRKKGLTEEELEPLDENNTNAIARGRRSNGAGRARRAWGQQSL